MAESSTLKDTFRFDQPGTLPRPGPIGRAFRLVLGVICVWLAWNVAFQAAISRVSERQAFMLDRSWVDGARLSRSIKISIPTLSARHHISPGDSKAWVKIVLGVATGAGVAVGLCVAGPVTCGVASRTLVAVGATVGAGVAASPETVGPGVLVAAALVTAAVGPGVGASDVVSVEPA